MLTHRLNLISLMTCDNRHNLITTSHWSAAQPAKMHGNTFIQSITCKIFSYIAISSLSTLFRIKEVRLPLLFPRECETCSINVVTIVKSEVSMNLLRKSTEVSG